MPNSTDSSTPHSHSDWWLIGLYMLLAGIFAVGYLEHQSLRLDEAQSIWQASHSVPHILQLVAEDVHVPLYHLLLHGWQRFFGTNLAAGRGLSLIFFLLSIPVAYQAGKVMFSRSTGLYTALLVTVSPFLNWYGSEIRMYSLLTLLTLLNQYAFVSLYKRNNTKRPLLYVGTALLGTFTHYFFMFVLLSECLFFMLHKKEFSAASRKVLYITAGIVGVALAPWIWYVVKLGSVSNTQPTLTAPTLTNIFNTVSQFLFGYQDDHLNTILVSLWPLATLLAFIALQKNKRLDRTAWFLLIAILVPLTGAFAVSLTFRPLFAARYLIVATPALYLFLAWIFSIYPRAIQYIAQIGLVLLMTGTLAHQTFSRDTPTKEDYAAVSEYLTAHAKSQDIILASAPFTIYPIEYYYHGPARLSTIPDWNRFAHGPIPSFSLEHLEQQVTALSNSYQTIWLVFSYDQGYQEDARLYFETHYHRLEERQFSPGLSLSAYQVRY